MYTDADVRRIRRLRDAVAAGHAIGRVAAMSDEQLATMSLAAGPEAAPAASRSPHSSVVDTTAIIDALNASMPRQSKPNWAGRPRCCVRRNC